MKKTTLRVKSKRSRKPGSKTARDVAPQKEIRGGFNFSKKQVDQDFH